MLPHGSASDADLFAVSGVASDDYWAVGARSLDHGADAATYAEHWDGTAWQPVRVPRPEDSVNDTFSRVVALTSSNVWAVGWAQPNFVEVAPFASHWNGRRWSTMYLKIPKGAKDTFASDVDGTSATDVWAVGSAGTFQSAQPLIEHWDGDRWSIAAQPADLPKNAELGGVRVISADDVWAVGEKTVAGRTLPFAEHYDGTSWKVMRVPLPQGRTEAYLLDVAGDVSRDLWAVGATPTHHPVIEHWNGHRWQAEPAHAAGQDMFATSVSVMAPDDVWVAGDTLDHHPVFVHWDGSAFHQVQVKTHASFIEGLASTSGNDAMAVGITITGRGGNATITPAHLRWNGHTWRDQN